MFKNTLNKTHDIYNLSGELLFQEVLSTPPKGKIAEEFFKKGNPLFDIFLAKKTASFLAKNKKSILSINLHPVSLINAKEFARIFKGVENQIILEIQEHDGTDLEHYSYFSEVMNNVGIKVALDDVNNNHRFEEILELTNPYMVKLDFPESKEELELFHRYINMTIALNPDCSIVVERVSMPHKLIWLQKNFEGIKMLAQGFLLNKPEKVALAS